MYLAECEGKAVGFGHAENGEIHAVFVDPDWVGKGVGRRSRHRGRHDVHRSILEKEVRIPREVGQRIERPGIARPAESSRHVVRPDRVGQALAGQRVPGSRLLFQVLRQIVRRSPA